MKREQVKDLLERGILQAYAEGKTIEYDSGGKWYSDSVEGHINFDDLPSRYRIKPVSFPPLPDGESYSNPEGFTPEQIGEGYRPLTVREHEAGVEAECRAEQWLKHEAIWVRKYPQWTYRVPADTPFLLPEPPRDLTPADCPPGAVFRAPEQTEGYILPQSVRATGLKLWWNNEYFLWSNLRTQGWTYSTDAGKTWNPCSK